MQSTFFFSVKWTQQEVLNSASGYNILDLHFLLAAAEDNLACQNHLACQNLMIEEENDDNA
jgi:hypothetical protein